MIQWSEEDEAYIAFVPELPGLSAFGSSAEEAARELSLAKEAYLEVLTEDEEEIPEPETLKPFSGQTRVRLPKSLHASLANQAKQQGVSLNTHIVYLLSERNLLSVTKDLIGGMEDRLYRAFLSLTPSPAEMTASSEEVHVIEVSLIDEGAFIRQ
jgi:predicted RNase H-like HicB family nuclease